MVWPVNTATDRGRTPTVVSPAPVPRGGQLLFTIVFWCGLATTVQLWWLRLPPAGSSDGVLTEAGRLTGLLAGYALLAQVLLMGRMPWLNRWIGAHTLTGWHRKLGAVIVVAVLGHLTLIVAGYAAYSEQPVLRQAWTMFDTYRDVAAAFAAAGLVGLLGLLGVRGLRRRMPYELWYWLHLASYLVLLLGYAHQFRYGRELADAGFGRWYWIGLHVFVAANVAWGRVVVPVFSNLRLRLTVLDAVREPDGSVSVYVGGSDLGRLPVRGGQFFRWRFLTPGLWWQSHPFSLSAIGEGWWRITVKPTGGYTRRLRLLRPGVRVWAQGPFGAFTAEHRRRPRALLIAAGSGIAPIRALLQETPLGAIVIYRAHGQSQLLFTEELADLARQRQATVWYVLGSRHDEQPRRLLSSRGLRGLVPDVTDRDVYLCGPPELIRACAGVLRRVGVPRRQIHLDPFQL